MISKSDVRRKHLHLGSNNSRNGLESQVSGDKRLHLGSNKSRNDLKIRPQEKNVSIQAVKIENDLKSGLRRKHLHSGSNKSRNDLRSQASGDKRLRSGSNNQGMTQKSGLRR